MNTRIGWPSMYWAQGTFTFFGYVCVCLLVVSALLMMVVILNEKPEYQITVVVDRGRRKSVLQPTAHACHIRAKLWTALVLLLFAALLLQCLPEARQGIQFLPCLPQAFSSWVASFISIACWLGFAGCALIVVLPGLDKAEGASLLILLTLGVNALLSFWKLDVSIETTQDSIPVIAETRQTGDDIAALFRDQLARWQEKRAAVQHTLERLVSEQERLLDRLLSLGVRSSDDLKSNTVALALADELAELIGQIKTVQEQVVRLDVAIARIESGLRRLERNKLMQTNGSLAEKELRQMTQTALELKEELRSRGAKPRIFSEFERDITLSEALRSRTGCQAKSIVHIKTEPK